MDLARIRFKGTADTLRQWNEALSAAANNKREFARIKSQLPALRGISFRFDPNVSNPEPRKDGLKNDDS